MREREGMSGLFLSHMTIKDRPPCLQHWGPTKTRKEAHLPQRREARGDGRPPPHTDPDTAHTASRKPCHLPRFPGARATGTRIIPPGSVCAQTRLCAQQILGIHSEYLLQRPLPSEGLTGLGGHRKE